METAALSSLYKASKGAVFGLSELAGRIVELSGQGASARLTAAFGLVLEAQQKGEPAAWVTLEQSSFFPPDAAEGGVDLLALAVVRVPDARAAGRAADQLLRSGGFGLVVADLMPARGGDRIPSPLLTRLAGLTQKHAAALVLLTEKSPDRSSASSLVSYRAEAARVRRRDGLALQVSVLKDKRRGPGAVFLEACRGPAGVR